jgi:succinate dehydrogenase / fumarate reductase, flavoprotein subunit
VFLDVSTRLPAEEIRRRLPSMHHQFKELADVDITAEPMEVGPTCHYVMGGVEVHPDTAATSVPGLFAAGEVAGGMHGSNRLGGNSLSDLLVFGRRAGAGAAAYVGLLGAERPVVAESDVSAAAEVALAPFATDTGENPYTLHQELQQTMNDLVGIIRREGEMKEALTRLTTFRERLAHLSVEGHRQFNPGWHLALDLRNMLLVSECIALAALERQESRGGHTREDHPGMDPTWRGVNLICRLPEPADPAAMVTLTRQPVPTMRRDLLELFDRSELGKYYTPAELSVLDIPAAADGSQEDHP